MLRDPSWVISRIAARIFLRGHRAQLTERDRKPARRLSVDPDVGDCLIDQSLEDIDLYSQVILPELKEREAHFNQGRGLEALLSIL